MPKFHLNARVKIVYHTKPQYRGLEGTVAEVHKVPKGSTQPVPDYGSLPQDGKQYHYDIKIDVYPHRLHRLHEEWLERSDRD